MKKTKFLTKVMAVVFALAILFAMSVPAFADGVNTYSGSNDPASTAITSGTDITLNKSIVFINVDNKPVYEPNITFIYDISAVDVADTTTITDGTTPTPNVVTVKDGELTTTKGDIFANANNQATISFGTAANSSTVSASSTGEEHERDTTITVNPNNFISAGVYRYLIRETSNIPVTDAGLTPRTTTGAGAYSADRYLDLYIRNSQATGAQPGDMELYGAVMFKTTTDGSNGSPQPGQDSITTATEKTTGFEPGDDPTNPSTPGYTYANDTTVDRYTTYNLNVTKNVGGPLGDKNNEFPFRFDLSNSIEGAKYTYEVTHDNGTPVVQTANILAGGTSTVNETYLQNTLALDDGDSFMIYGVPSNQTTTTPVSVVVSEKNNTPDTYKTSISGIATVAESDLAYNDTKGITATSIKNDTSNTLTFTNNLAQLSPTGLVFRVAPYVLMLLAGVSLILLFTKRRREVTDMI